MISKILGGSVRSAGVDERVRSATGLDDVGGGLKVFIGGSIMIGVFGEVEFVG